MTKTQIKTFNITTIEETTKEINTWAKECKLIIHQIVPVTEGGRQHIMVVYSKRQMCSF